MISRKLSAAKAKFLENVSTLEETTKAVAAWSKVAYYTPSTDATQQDADEKYSDSPSHPTRCPRGSSGATRDSQEAPEGTPAASRRRPGAPQRLLGDPRHRQCSQEGPKSPRMVPAAFSGRVDSQKRETVTHSGVAKWPVC